MKIKLALVFWVLTSCFAGAQEKTADQLRKAIVEEEVNQNLDKAIQAYQGIVAQYEEQRKTAATALMHLADCYRKQGKADVAVKTYQ